MYRNSPKLILKVDLEGDKNLKMMIILLDKYYTDHYKNSNLFLAKDGFTIFRGSLFTTFKTGSLHLPRNFIIGNHTTDKMSFVSDKERYEFLKRMQSAFVGWSKSPFWHGFTSKDRIKLTFRDKVWILF